MTAFQEIYVLNKRLKLAHTQNGFKTWIDSVLLAASCPAKAGEHILDMGCGVGGAGLSVLRRVEGVKLTGVEIQGDHATLATQNAQSNGFEQQCEFVTADIKDFNKGKRACKEESRSAPARLSDVKYDHVICNPPYLDGGAHLRSPSQEKATAMGHEVDALSLQDWVDTAYYCLHPKGLFTMIHRADKLDEIISCLSPRFGAIEIFPLWPKKGVPAKRVIIRAARDRKSPVILQAGLVLHNEDGSYSNAAEKIFRDMEALF